MDKIQIVLIVVSVLFILFVLQLTKKNKLREGYSLIWFFLGFIVFFFSVFRGFIDPLAAFVGIKVAPFIIIPFLIFVTFLLGMHFSIIISKLSEENKKLIQEVALLKNRIEKFEIGSNSKE